jgi:O-antigen/teichoic acid export membrane protein
VNKVNRLLLQISAILPPVATFGILMAATRRLTPEQLGISNLALTSVLTVQSILFYGIDTHALTLSSRAGPGELRQVEFEFLRVWLSLLVAVIPLWALGTILLAHSFEARACGWAGAFALIGRTLASQRAAFARGQVDGLRVFAIEGLQAAANLAVTIAVLPLGAAAPLLGAAVGATAASLLDVGWRLARRTEAETGPSTAGIRVLRVLHASTAMSINHAFAYILAVIDRYMLSAISGAATVGEYTASYALADRLMQSVGMVLSAGGLQDALRAVNIDARRLYDAYVDNARRVLFWLIPTAVGLCAISRPLAEVLLGVEFHESGAQLIPLIALGALFSYGKAYTIDHPYHVRDQRRLILAALLPALLLNIGLNVVLMPSLSYIGAAISTLASAVLAFGIGVALMPDRRYAMPWSDLAKIVACAGVMFAVTRLVNSALPWVTIFSRALVGGMTYLVASVVLNSCQTRSRLLLAARWRPA